jgi:uncharacterized paraquat-inducible protein A
MVELLANLPALLVGVGLVCLILTLAFIQAILRMNQQTTRAMLYELQKVSAALFLVHDLVEAPKVKGRRHIVRVGEHQRPPLGLPPAP